MTPAARVQAAIELLDLIIIAARDNAAAADTIVARWFKARRYAGSKDRAAVRALVYRAIRAFGDPPRSGRAAVLGLGDADVEALFDGTRHAPAPVEPGEPRAAPSLLPSWLAVAAPDWLDDAEAAAMLERAPLDLRIDPLKAKRSDILGLFDGAVALDGLEHGVRLTEQPDLEAHPAYRDGLVEVQDAGSQWIAAACATAPGQTVVDLCAGAGGKTLALAAAMAGQGRLIACDTDRRRLGQLAPRAARAGVVAIESRLLDPAREMEALGDLDAAADLVLIDAPCTGSGTWRRNPEARWRLTPARLDRQVALQAHVLDLGAQLVKPGGALVYAVCSILDAEGRDAIDAFLARHVGWRAVDPGIGAGRPRGTGRLLTPAHDRTDGFFVAKLEKR
jgi:16S rRNA (cytosine967-C5)-methyltransferase